MLCLRPMLYSMMKSQCLDNVIRNSFSTLPRIELPSPKEIHLWYIKPSEVQNESLLKQYEEILSPTEKDTVSQMRDEELRKKALLARTLVRTTIARYQINSQVSPKSLSFVKNAHGKPEVDWQHEDNLYPAPLHFNMSHTSSLIACAVAVDSPIGLDVEEKNRVTKHDLLSFAKRFFSKHEFQVLSAIPDPQVQRQELMKLWTLKEAYVKALGRGFSGAPFRSFTVRMRDGKNGSLMLNSDSECFQASEFVVDSLDGSTDFSSNWEFVLLELASTHYAAICTKMDLASEGKGSASKKVMVWKTIPFVEDNLVSGTNEVLVLSGLI